ncbi:hypothetical protein R1flu_026054 [Riccia fluitans]|uniref:Uncharacterized protein n=1 Tax=Riccia fluitans TaxID=41844 RepID=A0ABD1XHV5_9MARC
MGERIPQHDVEFKVEFELIPPSEELVPVELKVKALVLGDQRSTEVKSFIWKKVDRLKVGDVNEEDTSRVFCGETGKLLLCFHHAGKNPYGQGSSGSEKVDVGGTIRYATGYNGMISFSLEKDLFSYERRNFIKDPSGNKTYFNVTNVDDFAVIFQGETQEILLGTFVAPEFVRKWHGLAVVNKMREILASVKKSPHPLLRNIDFGDGPEFQIDVAPGVDWTTVLAIIGGFGHEFEDQGCNLFKDAVLDAFKALMRALSFCVTTFFF